MLKTNSASQHSHLSPSIKEKEINISSLGLFALDTSIELMNFIFITSLVRHYFGKIIGECWI